MAVLALPRSVRALAVAALLLVVLAGPAASQTVVDPTQAEFDPSPDHNTLVSGTAIVSHYRLALHAIGSSTAFTTANLGKPAPDPDGKIRVSLAGLFTVTPAPGVSYEARISAVGPGGTSGIASSNTFVFSATCAPSLTLVGQTLPAAGGSGSVDVTAGAGCGWSATSSAAWLTFPSGASGSGSATVTFSAAANTGTSPRTASISIAGQTFTVTQAAASCSYALSPTSQAVPATGGGGTASLTAGAGGTWTAASSAAWLTITGGHSGSGPGAIAFAASANPGTSSRTATVTAAGRTLTVTQAAASCTYAISPGAQTVSAPGGTGTVAVSTTSGCSWTAGSSVTWIRITEGANSSGSRSFGFSVAANTTSSVRTGVISVGGQAFTVTQKAHGVVPPSGLRMKASGKGQ